MKNFILLLTIYIVGTQTSHAEFVSMADLRDSLELAWLILAGALVFFMQTGFALLESGLSRAKNSINVILKNYSDACLGSIAYWAFGFGIMFGTNASGWIGTDHFMIGGLSDDKTFANLFFQTMFAATAATIASGAMAERTRFGTYLIGSVIITAVIYPVFGSWAWGGQIAEGQGWLARMGFIDFAGSTVVHSVGGWCALAAVLVLGPRLGKFGPKGEPRSIPGHNLTLVALGAFILWLGWFGFNAGSAAITDGIAGRIVLNTQLAASGGVAGTLLLLFIFRKPILMTGVINGSLGGLVSITAGCATMDPFYAIVTGMIAGGVVILGTSFLDSMKIDDVVGAVPVHAFCGVWGTIAAGMFLSGNMFNFGQVGVQLVGVTAAFIWTFPLAYISFWVINVALRLRTTTVNEQKGMDYTEHSELGYPEFQTIKLHED